MQPRTEHGAETHRAYCSFCGNPLRPESIAKGTGTCRSDCTRKLAAFCGKVATRVHDAAVFAAQQDGGEHIEYRRDVKEDLWSRLFKPVIATDRCVDAPGFERILPLLASIAGNGCVADRLDVATYEKLVGNGWCEFDDNVHWALKHAARPTPAGPVARPWDKADKKPAGRYVLKRVDDVAPREPPAFDRPKRVGAVVRLPDNEKEQV